MNLFTNILRFSAAYALDGFPNLLPNFTISAILEVAGKSFDIRDATVRRD